MMPPSSHIRSSPFLSLSLALSLSHIHLSPETIPHSPHLFFFLYAPLSPTFKINPGQIASHEGPRLLLLLLLLVLLLFLIFFCLSSSDRTTRHNNRYILPPIILPFDISGADPRRESLPGFHLAIYLWDTNKWRPFNQPVWREGRTDGLRPGTMAKRVCTGLNLKPPHVTRFTLTTEISM